MMTLRNGLVVAALSLVGLLPSADAWAYQTLQPCNPRWQPSNLPNPYYINPANSDLDADGNGRPNEAADEARLIEVIEESWKAWTEPCCSNFRVAYQGRTDGVGENRGDRRFIISFRNSTWPRELGDQNQTIAVTLPATSFNCTIQSADMVFNAVGFNFTVVNNPGFGQTDLQSIATHEQGHWLGLDHTPIQQATMYFAYSGGTGARSLHQDDIDGVCFLYEKSCSCATDGDCPDEQVCRDSACITPPCTETGCATGLECNTASGQCVVPPCRSDDDCSGGRTCESGTCVAREDCAICRDCSRDDECGVGSVCVPPQQGFGGFCTQLCNAPSDCPGNSQCFSVPGQNFSVCLNPEAASGNLCPDSYVCTDATTDLCDGVTCPTGQTCNPSTGLCQGGGSSDCPVCTPCGAQGQCAGGGVCVGAQGGTPFCTLQCSGAADCPTNTVCVPNIPTQNGGTVSLCLNSDFQTAGPCPAGFTCGGTTDRCAGVSCTGGQTCNPATGRCEGGTTPGPDAGTTPDATPDSTPGRDTSVGADTTPGRDAGSGGNLPSCTVCRTCNVDSDCRNGPCVGINGARVCTVPCDNQACPGDSTCYDLPLETGGSGRFCLNDVSQFENVICPSDYTCTPRSGEVDGSDPGTDPDGTLGRIPDDGCNCSATPSPVPTPMALLVAASLLALRRRRGRGSEGARA